MRCINSLIILVCITVLTACCQESTMEHRLPDAYYQSLIDMANVPYMECSGKASFQYESFYTLPSGDLLILVALPDYRCDSNSFVPVRFALDGTWSIGQRIEGQASFFMAANMNDLWLLSHWVIEGVSPLLHHSQNGTDWQQLDLPNSKLIDCCFVHVSKFCVSQQNIAVSYEAGEFAPQGYWTKSFNEDKWQPVKPETLNAFSEFKHKSTCTIASNGAEEIAKKQTDGSVSWQRYTPNDLSQTGFVLKKHNGEIRLLLPNFYN